MTIPNYVVVDEHMDTGLAYDLTQLVAGTDLSPRPARDRAHRAAPGRAGLLRPRGALTV